MKSRIRKTLSAVALLAALVFVLSGCIHMNFSLKVNKDDSVDWAYEMTMSDELISLANAQGGDTWAEATTQAEGQGFKVEKIPSTDGYSGIRATKHYKSVEEFNNDQSKLSGTEGTAGQTQTTLSVTNVDGTYKISMKMDASGQMAQATNQEGMDDASKQMMQGFMDQIQVNFVATLPFKADSHNATSVSEDGLTYTWKMDLTKPNDIQLTAKKPGGIAAILASIGSLSGPVFYAAIGVIAVLIVVIVLLAVSVSKKRKAARAAQTPVA